MNTLLNYIQVLLRRDAGGHWEKKERNECDFSDYILIVTLTIPWLITTTTLISKTRTYFHSISFNFVLSANRERGREAIISLEILLAIKLHKLSHRNASVQSVR